MNPIRRPLRWLFEALQLDGPDLPQYLDADRGVVPVVDVAEHGWTNAAFSTIRATSAGGAAVYQGVFLRDPDNYRVVTAMHVESLNVIAYAEIRIALLDPVGRETIVFQSDLPLNELRVVSPVPIHIPPNYLLTLYTDLGGSGARTTVTSTLIPDGSYIG